ncbi:MAG: thiamine-phosphate kinase [Chloroflexota bacterium]|nr:thiamine-phosphate kinase [Chloroflexota bacterium]
MTRPTVRDLGEFGLIERLRSALPAEVRSGPGLTLGIGDDAAVWQPPDPGAIVISTDAMVEGVHFRLDPGWSTWADTGHKALAVNLSDLAAMGARPRLAVVTVALRGDEAVEDVTSAYTALGDLAAAAGCLVAGGDIVAAPVVSWHVTVIGQAGPAGVLRRDGARPGDLIAVSGTLGASAAGFQILNGDPDDPRRTASTAPLLLEAHRRPRPRLALGAALAERGATAAMDLSDGLLGDLPKILVASEVGADIEVARIPVAAAVRALFPGSWSELALRGGEDYELLFTMRPDDFPAIEAAAREIGNPVTVIGRIVARSTGEPADAPRLRLRDLDGSWRDVSGGAFDHFGRDQTGADAR